jgi:hypothetical protein
MESSTDENIVFCGGGITHSGNLGTAKIYALAFDESIELITSKTLEIPRTNSTMVSCITR